MQWPSAGEWIAIIAIIVTVSLIAGIVVTWREERKREKEQERERERWRREKPD
ncbi:hypothetical protein ES703_15863 [subsurface metagenome]